MFHFVSLVFFAWIVEGARGGQRVNGRNEMQISDQMSATLKNTQKATDLRLSAYNT